MNKSTIFSYLLLLVCLPSYSSPFTFKGQINSWLLLNPFNGFKAQAGARYIPSAALEKQVKKIKFDAEISVNAYAFCNYNDSGLTADANLKPYRAWIRLSTEQFELRAGLQKINFGSASILRPLMWFDRIDPRDPLQLTDGVYGLLARYYFLNNANIWLWGLYGNNTVKGWEFVPSNKKRPEFGGRFQYPVPKGELALTYHNREVDFSRAPALSLLTNLGNVMENRIGIDGKWDVGPGLWFEGVMQYQDIPSSYLPWQRQLNIGIDFTFNIGNGLKASHEFLWSGNSKNALGNDKAISFSALNLSYPFDMLDNIMAMIYYDWTNKNLYSFLNFNRVYDNWIFYVMAFWNPDKFGLYNANADQNLFAGKGLQVMVVYNH